MDTYDCLIIGGGAAGLNAATVLARCRRSVLLVDAGKQSNHASRASHGVFGHDGQAPETLYQAAREQLAAYPSAQATCDQIVSIAGSNNKFTATTRTHKTIRARTIILAQGVAYTLPDIPGLQSIWGTKAWHCPYCDGYEHRDQKLLIVTSLGGVEHISLILPSWSKNLYYAINPAKLPNNVVSRIEKSGGNFTPGVKSFEDQPSGIKVTFSDGSHDNFDSIVIGPDIKPYDDLAYSLGCTRGEQQVVERDDYGRTSIPGVYVAGDQTDIMQQVNVAVASGHKAAVGVHEDLCQIERSLESSA